MAENDLHQVISLYHYGDLGLLKMNKFIIIRYVVNQSEFFYCYFQENPANRIFVTSCKLYQISVPFLIAKLDLVLLVVLLSARKLHLRIAIPNVQNVLRLQNLLADWTRALEQLFRIYHFPVAKRNPHHLSLDSAFGVDTFSFKVQTGIHTSMTVLGIIRAEMLYLAVRVVGVIDVRAKGDVCLFVLVLIFVAFFVNMDCKRIVH